MLKLYIIGWSILIIAIVANVVAEKIGISTWYDFGSQFFNQDSLTFKEIGVINLLWLFIIYPIILSFGYIIGEKIYSLF